MTRNLECMTHASSATTPPALIGCPATGSARSARSECAGWAAHGFFASTTAGTQPSGTLPAVARS